jgi:hypothetical protein
VRATDTWDRLEKVFEDRVQRALNRLGIPGREEVAGLTARVDALTAQLRRGDSRPAARAAKKPAPAKKAATRKPAAKKAGAAKKSAPAKKAAPRKVARAASASGRKTLPKAPRPIAPQG